MMVYIPTLLPIGIITKSTSPQTDSMSRFVTQKAWLRIPDLKAQGIEDTVTVIEDTLLQRVRFYISTQHNITHPSLSKKAQTGFMNNLLPSCTTAISLNWNTA